MPQCCVDTILIIVDNTFSLNYKGQCKHFAQNNKKTNSMLHGKLCGNHIYIQYLDLNSTKPNINPAAQNFDSKIS